MAEKKHRSQAERAVSASKHKSGSDKSAPKQTGKTAQKDQSSSEKNKNIQSNIPVRFYTSATFLGLFIFLLVISLNQEGALTGLICELLYGLVGVVGFIIAIPVMLYLFFIHAFSGKRPVIMRSICLGAFVLICGCLHHLFSNPTVSPGLAMFADLFEKGNHSSGGIICGSITVLLVKLLNPWLTGILLVIGAVFTLLGGMQITIPSIIRAVQNRPRAEWEDEEPEEVPEPAAVVVNHIANKRIEYVENKRNKAKALAAANPTKEERVAEMMRQIGGDIETPVSVAGGTAASNPGPELLGVPEVSKPAPAEVKKPDPAPASQPVIPHAEEAAPVKQDPKSGMPILDLTEKPQSNRVVKPRKVTAKEAEESAAAVTQEISQNESQDPVQYCYPPIDLLKLPGGGVSDGTGEMRANSELLKEALASFKIDARIINVTRGPSITRYEVELDKGVRLSKLTSASEDLALSLGATGVRIAAIPDKISVVGIEVPNKAVNTVTLREVIGSTDFSKAKSKASFAVGKDIGGSCIVGNITKLPHMLIAGTTGSGKSVCMNSIIISLLYKASPDDVKLIMVDPKMVELGVYNGIPHLLIPVVTDPKKAAGSLQWAVSEMMRRYKAMSDAGVRDLESYNSIVTMEEGKKLPQVVVIIDELADLMLVAAKEVEESICRIAQMGRAAGIHLIIATQRPSADVITGLMKANIPSRIAFSVASAMESRIILDTQGAEKLVGKGDMLFAPIGAGKPKRVQGCFVSDSEVEAVATYVKNNYTSSYDQQIMEEIEKAAKKETKGMAAEPEPTAEELDGDEMLPAAVDVILETGQASVSMLQRRLKLGYARAARIVDEMEEKGIVGPFQGSKPRSILITKEQWEAMRSNQPLQMEMEEMPEEDNVPFDTDE